MQELIVDFITSLDGYGAAEGWPGLWGLQGPEYLGWLGEQSERDYTILMGANTYRLMSGFAAESEPSETDEDAHRRRRRHGGACQSVQGGVLLDAATPDVLAQYPADRRGCGRSRSCDEAGRRQPDAHAGQPDVVPVAPQAGLVDRFRVVVFPVITGSSGRDRIYDGYPDIALDMVASRTFDSRIQLLEYVPTMLTGPPGEE